MIIIRHGAGTVNFCFASSVKYATIKTIIEKEMHRMERYLGESIPKLGFGLMRLPMKDEKIDIEQVKEMVDLFMDAGFRYFDTAYGYNNGDSERAAKEALIDERKANSAIRNISSNNGNVDEDEVPEEEQERSVQELQEAAAEEGLTTDASLDDRD
jgi:predicted aldo/keto reductase-like oxidoreductase